jgi:hypothetical protein
MSGPSPDGLENRADRDAKRLAAAVALVDADPRALTVHFADAIGLSTAVANGAIWPKRGFDEAVSFGFIVKVRLRKI